MADAPKKRTPSPRVVAAQLVDRALNAAAELSAAEMTKFSGSRISEDKRVKVLAWIAKMVRTPQTRARKTIATFEAGPKPRPHAKPLRRPAPLEGKPHEPEPEQPA